MVDAARPDEAARLAALARYEILDSPGEDAYEELAQLAAHVCAAPLAVVDFVDAERVWVKAAVGSLPSELPRDRSFADRVVEARHVVVVRDAAADPRLAGAAFVAGEPLVRFLAGAPIRTPDGFVIGTLTVMDPRPRALSTEQAAALISVCRQVGSQLELRRHLSELQTASAERALVEEAVRGRDEAIQMLVDQMPAILWAVDRDLRFTSSVGAGLAALGLEPGQVVGMSLQEFFGTDDPGFGAIAAHRLALGGERTAYEQNWQGRRFETHVMPLRSRDGGIVGALGVALDVTERMWEEGALFQAEVKYRGLIETIPAVTYIDPLDEWSDSLYVSPQVTELLGCTQQEWMTDPRSWSRRVHPDDYDRVWEEYVRARDAGAPYHNEYRMIHVDGHVVWVSERAVVLHDPDGRPWCVQGVIVDITERKRVEEELERAWQGEREAAEHLRAVDELKNLQLHAVSHDLRGPITAVLGSALVLDQGGSELDEERRRDLVHLIAASARKLNRLVNDLLDLDRLERGIVEPNRRTTDVTELVTRLVDELAIEDHPVEVVAPPVVASVDPVQTERIVENLILNAAGHTPVGTPIWVRLCSQAQGTAIVVEDAGPGVPQELRPVIFEPFRHGASGRGLGIGLSLVAGFAELHGGWVRVGDRDGGGASFEVFLADGPPAPDAAGDGARVDAASLSASP
jgi:PAS domain S-box-containing protein